LLTKFLDGNSDGKKTFKRTGSIILKLDLRVIGYEVMDWIELVRDRDQ
jgi:hypothetical protein